MAQIVVTVPDAVLQRVLDAFAAAYGYQATIDGSPNPETKAQFARRMVRQYVKNTVVAHEAEQAAITARQTAADAANTDIVLS